MERKPFFSCVLVYSDQGLGRMTRTYHDLYRQHLIEKRWLTEDRPILVNNWEATMMKCDLRFGSWEVVSGDVTISNNQFRQTKQESKHQYIKKSGLAC